MRAAGGTDGEGEGCCGCTGAVGGHEVEASSRCCPQQALLLAPGAARGLLEPCKTARARLMSGLSLLPDASPALPRHKEACKEVAID